MERLFLECAVRAALLAGTVAIVLYAMRVKEGGFLMTKGTICQPGGIISELPFDPEK